MGNTALRQVHAQFVGELAQHADRVTHPGLRFDRFVPRGAMQQETVDALDAFLRSFESVSARSLGPYTRFFRLWEEALATRPHLFRSVWPTRGRLALGLGDESVLEIGIRLHRTYGVPVIPGSAQKGLVWRYAQSVFGLRQGTPLFRALFGEGGHTGQAGSVTFHDALWSPDSRQGPFVRDVTTVHHPGYYQQGLEPGEWDAPNPLHYLAAVGSFLFAIEGQVDAVAFCSRVLGLALADWGIGARTLKGYGRFDTGLEPPQGTNQSLWPEPEGQVTPAPLRHPATPATSPTRTVPPTSTAQVRTAEGVMVRFLPQLGAFEVELGGKKARAEAKQEALFASPEHKEQTLARCRKKGFCRARVQYTQTDNLLELRRIEPELPR